MQEEQASFDEEIAAIFGTEEVKIANLFRLSDMSSEGFATFLANWESCDEERRRIITRHMADITETNFEVEFAPVFQICLADPSEAVVLAALDGLWDSTNTAVVPTIISLLKSGNSAEIRRAAAATLAHYVLLGEWGQVPTSVKDKVVAALLAEHVEIGNPISLRRATLESLGAASHEDVPGLIAEAYEAEDRGLQISAVFAMGNSADERWLHTIIAEMESPFYTMRAEAARAAGEIGDSTAISPLADLVYDGEQDVQIAAIEALGKLNSERAKDVLTLALEDPEMADFSDVLKQALTGDDPLAAFALDDFDDEFDFDLDEVDQFDEEYNPDYDDEYDFED